jgi:hypothetical protein
MFTHRLSEHIYISTYIRSHTLSNIKTPSGEDILEAIKASYNMPATLVVGFENDSFDETDKLYETLLEKGCRVERKRLQGAHFTPCEFFCLVCVYALVCVSDTCAFFTLHVHALRVVSTLGELILGRRIRRVAYQTYPVHTKIYSYTHILKHIYTHTHTHTHTYIQ